MNKDFLRTVIIRNLDTGLVLDGDQTVIELQKFTTKASQLWFLESLGDGKFYIINLLTGQALDIQSAAQYSSYALICPRNRNPTQQWYINSDKTIGNAGGLGNDMVLHVYDCFNMIGSKVIIHEKNSQFNQVFEVVFAS